MFITHLPKRLKVYTEGVEQRKSVTERESGLIEEETMAISGDLRVSATLASSYPLSSNLRRSLPTSKVGFGRFLTGRSNISEMTPKFPRIKHETHIMQCNFDRSFGITGENKISSEPAINQLTESLLLNAITMNFFDRLNLAWKILFPPPATRRSSNALIAKQRLKMILFSDRCAVSDEAKQKIVGNIVGALSDFVEIDSEDKVQLNVSTDPDLGTVYSVTIPVRRVKSEYQEEDEFELLTNEKLL